MGSRGGAQILEGGHLTLHYPEILRRKKKINWQGNKLIILKYEWPTNQKLMCWKQYYFRIFAICMYSFTVTLWAMPLPYIQVIYVYVYDSFDQQNLIVMIPPSIIFWSYKDIHVLTRFLFLTLNVHTCMYKPVCITHKLVETNHIPLGRSHLCLNTCIAESVWVFFTIVV